MSRAHITDQYATDDGYVVVFNTAKGPRAYKYTSAEGAQIISGAEPRHLKGKPIDLSADKE